MLPPSSAPRVSRNANDEGRCGPRARDRGTKPQDTGSIEMRTRGHDDTMLVHPEQPSPAPPCPIRSGSIEESTDVEHRHHTPGGVRRRKNTAGSVRRVRRRHEGRDHLRGRVPAGSERARQDVPTPRGRRRVRGGDRGRPRRGGRVRARFGQLRPAGRAARTARDGRVSREPLPAAGLDEAAPSTDAQRHRGRPARPGALGTEQSRRVRPHALLGVPAGEPRRSRSRDRAGRLRGDRRRVARGAADRQRPRGDPRRLVDRGRAPPGAQDDDRRAREPVRHLPRPRDRAREPRSHRLARRPDRRPGTSAPGHRAPALRASVDRQRGDAGRGRRGRQGQHEGPVHRSADGEHVPEPGTPVRAADGLAPVLLRPADLEHAVPREGHGSPGRGTPDPADRRGRGRRGTLTLAPAAARG